MALVICDMSISLDGYVTGPNDSRENPFGDGAGMLHDWLFDAAADDDRALLEELVDGVGAVVMGRKSFDKNEGEGGWGEGGPLGDIPCFVVTHNKPAASYPSLFTFVTDGVASAIEQARNVAGDKVVGLHGATVMQQALPLSLVDEIRSDTHRVSRDPVSHGRDPAQHPLEDLHTVIQGDRVLHLRYRVRR